MNDFFLNYQDVPLVMSVIETPAHRQVNPAATNFFATEKIEKIPEIRWKPPKILSLPVDCWRIQGPVYFSPCSKYLFF